MRSALLSLCAAILLGCGESRPSSTFLFPGERPIARGADQHDQQRLHTSQGLQVQGVQDQLAPAGETTRLTYRQVSTDSGRSLSEERAVGSSSSVSHSSSMKLVAKPARDVVGVVSVGPRSGGSDRWVQSARPTDGRLAGARLVPRVDNGIVTHSTSRAAEAVAETMPVRPGSLQNSPSRQQSSIGVPYPAVTAPSRTAASRPLVSGGIVFPDASGAAELAGSLTPLPSCDGQNVSAVNPASGRCELLGAVSSCQDGQLFLLAADGTSPSCRPLPCPEDQLLVGGSCRSVDDPLACPSNMALAMDERGGGRCDCRPGHVFWAPERRCYPALSQGPCPVGSYLTAPADEPRPRCAENVCVRDGSLLWMQPPLIGCYPLQAPGAGCESERLLLLQDGLLVCDSMAVMMRSIFDLPEVRCGGSELMDYAGRCRHQLLQGFRGRR